MHCEMYLFRGYWKGVLHICIYTFSTTRCVLFCGVLYCTRDIKIEKRRTDVLLLQVTVQTLSFIVFGFDICIYGLVIL